MNSLSAPLHNRSPHQVSPPKIGRAPQTGVGTPTRRPTTEDWHRAASLLPDTPLTSNPNPPRQQPAPPDSDQRPERSGPRLTKLRYWVAVIAIAFLTFVLAGGLNPSQQTQIDGSTILLFLVMYLPVAVLRARDIGFSWWSSVVITLVVGALFVPFLIIWLGTAKSTAGLPLWQANWNKLFLVGIAVFIAIMAVIVVVAITMVPQPSGANPPNQPGLTVCDTWLRAQLNSSTATPNTNATNDAIEAIQAGRPAQCPPGAWNPSGERPRP